MSLKKYREKRDFTKTPEPKGKKAPQSSKKLYVIHKHAASHLHYDLRLELEGVLKSWAVPKGPCFDPKVKRLAVHVEDHPLNYGSFEGIIPEKQYGAGTVMLWDTGEWEPLEENAIKAYKKGNLAFELKGKKLKGAWKLVQIKNDPKNWLLIKSTDKYAQSIDDYDVTVEKNKSVLSKKSMKSIAGKKSKTSVSLSNKSKMPIVISPQLATLVDAPPEGDLWLHEIKLDGYRLICFVNKGKVRLMTRSNQDWTDKFPDVVIKLRKLKLTNAIFDGEIVALDKNQRSNFQMLQNSINNQTDTPLLYYVFDLIYYDNHDLTNLPLIERKTTLKKLISSTTDPNLRYSEHIIGNGKKLFKEACQMSLEGIMSKQINSFYIEKRSKSWLKVKCTKRQEFVVGGFTKPQGQRGYFGSLLIGAYDENKKLQYCGHVGTGFNQNSLREIASLLKQSTQMPFTRRPPDVKNVTWTVPNIIIEVEFTEKTTDGILRHPSFKGVRKDKPAREITMEETHSITKTESSLPYPLTNPDKILYPEHNITKRALAEYYHNIKDWILPYIVERPLTLVRCPEGRQKACFYQKHLTEKNIKGLYSVPIKEKNQTAEYIYIKDEIGLLAFAQLGVLEIHPWNCHIDNVEKPDLVIFDLDPAPDVKWKQVVNAAYYLKDKLEEINLTSFIKVTGGKGVHLVLPIKRLATWTEVKEFSHSFVNTIAELKPDEFVAQMTKSKRNGKIFIDYLRNQRGATSVAPYSTRAREDAPIATPISWEELPKVKPNQFTLENLSKRLAKLANDPWEDFFKVKQKIIK